MYKRQSLDLRSVLRASQAISEELELEGILEKLMYSLLECAGAQNIYFLAKTDSGYEIQAESHSGAADSCVISRRPATDADVPLGIVSFVERTAETIILDDGERSRLYGKEAHIRESRCKSVLCMPVQSKGELKGILLSLIHIFHPEHRAHQKRLWQPQRGAEDVYNRQVLHRVLIEFVPKQSQ